MHLGGISLILIMSLKIGFNFIQQSLIYNLGSLLPQKQRQSGPPPKSGSLPPPSGSLPPQSGSLPPPSGE